MLHVEARRSRFYYLQLTPIRPPPRRAALATLAEALADDPLEREPEVLREQRVYQRVYRAVAVAQPEEDGEHHGVYAVDAERADQVHGEEGQPAEDEAADDDAQGLGGLRLHAEALHLGLDVALAHALGRRLGLVVAVAGAGARQAFYAAVAAAGAAGWAAVGAQALYF